ncbi:TPA: lipoyl synthase [Candidatus Poribacteria bacterium]|nr:lipoyl synthase [Candidatus Poribacteria bacterium]
MQKIRPDWLKKRIKIDDQQIRVHELLDGLHLNTVCQSAVCPNIAECFAKGTATFMILGNICTRNCRFCAIESGKPLPIDDDEPRRLALAVKEMGLKHVVITSVTRDDLPDGGASHFAKTINELHKNLSYATIEVLTPDFKGDESALSIVLKSKPDIFNHNVETVPRLYPKVRPMADYDRSLSVLEKAKKIDPQIYTKSGIMIGLSETRSEISQVLKDLIAVGCDIITIGQYLSPSNLHVRIHEYISPEVFKDIEYEARELGFSYVASGPFVRSSFNAEEAFEFLRNINRRVKSEKGY